MPTTLQSIDVRRYAKKIDEALDREEIEVLRPLYQDLQDVVDVPLLKQLQAQAMKGVKDGWEKDDLDGWVAPRLHCALRMPRRVAANPGVWSWLALEVFTPYMRERWPDKAEQGGWWRYHSPDLLRNGISRLWWAAELVRDGSDYSLVPDALAEVRIYHNVSELRYSWHRETARAMTRALTDLEKNGDALGPLFNADLAARCLETNDWEYESDARCSWDPIWGEERPTLKQLLQPVASLRGPAAGDSRQDIEEEIYRWLLDLNAESEA